MHEEFMRMIGIQIVQDLYSTKKVEECVLMKITKEYTMTIRMDTR